jgi:NAD(P)H-dependent FMN reductase
MPLVKIIVASTRPGRVGLPIAEWVHAIARERSDIEVELVDLREVNLPIHDEPHHPRLGKYEHEHTRRWSASVERADGFIFVTPEYNHSFPASLKNALDFVFREWAHKPVGIVSYGGVAAGTRSVQALKPVLAALQMIPVLESVNIPFVANLFDADKKLTTDKGLDDAARLMVERLVFWMGHQRPLYRS